MKELILEAQDKGPVALYFVLPFVCIILRAATNSVFAPPCPYTMAVLKVLRELYDYFDIKVQLKFEVCIISSSKIFLIPVIKWAQVVVTYYAI